MSLADDIKAARKAVTDARVPSCFTCTDAVRCCAAAYDTVTCRDDFEQKKDAAEKVVRDAAVTP